MNRRSFLTIIIVAATLVGCNSPRHNREFSNDPIVCVHQDDHFPDYADCFLRGPAGNGVFRLRYGASISVQDKTYKLKDKPR